MKQFTLKEIALPNGDKKLNYGDLIKTIVQAPASEKGGMGVAEMRSRLKILDAVDAAVDTVASFEDAEVDKLKDLVANFNNWSMVNKEIVDFSDAIAAL